MNTPLQKKLQNIFTLLISIVIVILFIPVINAQSTTVKIDHANAWEDLQSYLPEAKMAGTSVIIELLPPSECPPINTAGNYSEPYRLDFTTWVKEIAKLSLRYSNLKGYGIENLLQNINLGYLSQTYVNNFKSSRTSYKSKTAIH